MITGRSTHAPRRFANPRSSQVLLVTITKQTSTSPQPGPGRLAKKSKIRRLSWVVETDYSSDLRDPLPPEALRR